MWDESGQSIVEAALMMAAIAGALLLAAPLFEAWRDREAAVRAVIELPLP